MITAVPETYAVGDDEVLGESRFFERRHRRLRDMALTALLRAFTELPVIHEEEAKLLIKFLVNRRRGLTGGCVEGANSGGPTVEFQVIAPLKHHQGLVVCVADALLELGFAWPRGHHQAMAWRAGIPAAMPWCVPRQLAENGRR